MIISVGEVVWDIFTDRQILGGAPLNVAYHLQSLNMEVMFISRVGTDALGESTVEHIQTLGLSTAGIQIDNLLPTGRVNVTVDEHNEPHFDIVAPAAWDNIDTLDALQVVAEKCPGSFHLVYGTLAQRNAISRKAIHALRQKAELCFYDVNLRPPFTTEELVLESLEISDIVKMNDNEICTVAGWLSIPFENPKEAARAILERYNLKLLVVTAGAHGAWLVDKDNYYEHPGFPATIADTVGAGDAFFAALIEGYINDYPPSDCLARANKRGSYVASRNGATPEMGL